MSRAGDGWNFSASLDADERSAVVVEVDQDVLTHTGYKFVVDADGLMYAAPGHTSMHVEILDGRGLDYATSILGYLMVDALDISVEVYGPGRDHPAEAVLRAVAAWLRRGAPLEVREET